MVLDQSSQAATPRTPTATPQTSPTFNAPAAAALWEAEAAADVPLVFSTIDVVTDTETEIEV
jgi:hypothetical protein